MIFGRDRELTALNTAYAQMLAGHGSVLFLTGEAGLGKTTLVHTWATTRDTQSTSEQQSTVLDTQPTTLFLESACSIPIGNVDVGRLEALQPWADVVAQLHEKLSTQSTSKSKTQHKLNLGKLMRDSAPAWLWALPFVGEVAHAALVTARLANDQRTGTKSHVHSPTGPDPSLEDRSFAAANQEQVFQQYVNLLTKISEATPLVIFLDDLHWADTSSCNLLFYLARQIAGKKILVIATYRQDDAVNANEGKGHAIITVKNEILRYSTGTELALSYLSRDAIRAFLSNTFTAHNSGTTSAAYVADETFERWLHRISDGNSLFMTQFVRTLREDEHLDDSGRFVGDYATVVIPKSALAVVEERTRRLDADTRKLLMYATAEGEEFTTYVLERLTGKNSMQLLEELQAAATMGLIMQRGTARLYANMTTAIFGFSHALFHKALYDSLFDLQKQHLHQQCFQLLKTEWDRLSDTKGRTTTIATKLLAHAEKCEEWETVAEVALAAGQEFWRAFNEDEALTMITRVLDACNCAEGITNAEDIKGGLKSQGADWVRVQRGEAWILRGEIDKLRGRYEEAINDYRAAEVEFSRAALPNRAVDAVNGLARVLYRTSSYDEALAEASRAIDQARTVGHRQGEALALNIYGLINSDRGASDEALMQFERSRELCAEIGHVVGEGNALNNIGNVYMGRAEYDKALQKYKQSFTIFSAIGNRAGEASTLGNIGIVYADSGTPDEALSYYERALAIHTAIGNREGESSQLNQLGNFHKLRSNYELALSLLERSLNISSAIGDHGVKAYALMNIADVYDDLGEDDKAFAHYEQSVAEFELVGYRLGEGRALMSLGNLHVQHGHFDEAMSLYTMSLEIETEIGNRVGEAFALMNIGLLHIERGAYSESLPFFEQSLSICTAKGHVVGEACAILDIGIAQRNLQKFSDARENLERSRTMALKISAGDTVPSCTAELGLLAEAESQTLVGAERDVKRAEAQRLIEEALVMFREMRLVKMIAKWEKELQRIKASA